MLYILLLLTILLLGTTIWYYSKWRDALKTNHLPKKETSSLISQKEEVGTSEESFMHTIEACTNSLESTYPEYRFIQYHEDALISTPPHIINDVQVLVLSIVTLLNDNNTGPSQILLHSRLKENQLLLRLQLPALTEVDLKKIISENLIINYHLTWTTQGQLSIIKMSLPTTATTIKKVKVIPTVPTSTSKEDQPQLDTDDSAILIIEDNKEIADFIATCIPRKYKSFISNDGKSGASTAFELIPDLIISDIMMPQLNGLELCDLLKNDLRTEHIPIILLTAKVADQDKLEGLKHGADAYLTKPFDETELQLRIDNLLSLRDKIRKKQSITNRKPAINELFITALRSQLEANYILDEYGVQQLADSLHMSRMQLHRKVKSTLNLTTSEVMNEFRLEKAHRLIKDSKKRMSEIAYEVGFSDAGYFSKVYKLKYGLSPSQMREK